MINSMCIQGASYTEISLSSLRYVLYHLTRVRLDGGVCLIPQCNEVLAIQIALICEKLQDLEARGVN